MSTNNSDFINKLDLCLQLWMASFLSLKSSQTTSESNPSCADDLLLLILAVQAAFEARILLLQFIQVAAKLYCVNIRRYYYHYRSKPPLN